MLTDLSRVEHFILKQVIDRDNSKASQRTKSLARFLNVCVCVCVCVHACSVVSDFLRPMDYNPPGSSVHGIFQARILELVGTSYSSASSPPKDQTHISCVSCVFTTEPPTGTIFQFFLNTSSTCKVKDTEQTLRKCCGENEQYYKHVDETLQYKLVTHHPLPQTVTQAS